MNRLAHPILRLLVVVALQVPNLIGVQGVARADRLRLHKGDLEQGVEVALAVDRQVGLIEDEETLERIYDLGARVAYATRDDETVYSFHVVDMPEPNAFAVPGGFIFLTQGMLDLELGDDALGYLLGHEIAHVNGHHASRMGFWGTITSILQAAVIIGAAVAVSGASAERPVYEDEYGRVYSRTAGGTADALAGASVFSTIFRELFLRGYSRKLEMEADIEGSRLASAAGFSPQGGVELLATLNDRIYEDSAYSYWRTHPFFEDRLRSAQARLGRTTTGPDSLAMHAYRQEVQMELSRVAGDTRNKAAATLLYRNALRWGTSEHANAPIQLELVRFHLVREEEKRPLDRRLGPLLADLDRLAARAGGEAVDVGDAVDAVDAVDTGDAIDAVDAGDAIDAVDTVDAARDDSEAAFAVAVESERQRITNQLAAMLPDYLALLDAPGAAANHHLQLFADNFPEHPRAASARLAIARRLVRDERPDDAVPVLRALLETSPPDSLLDASCRLLASCATTVTGLVSCYEIIDAPPDSAIAALATARLQTLMTELEDLEAGARFLKRWPDTLYTDPVRSRVDELAASEVRFGRVFEAGGKPQKALDIYNRVVLLVPDSPAAEDAWRGIERIHLMGQG